MENIQKFTLEERYQEGLKYIKSRNYDKAEKVFYEILKKSPNHLNSLFLMGFSLYEQKKNFIALKYLGKASMLKKNFRDADYFIGKIYKNTKPKYSILIVTSPKHSMRMSLLLSSNGYSVSCFVEKLENKINFYSFLPDSRTINSINSSLYEYLAIIKYIFLKYISISDNYE